MDPKKVLTGDLPLQTETTVFILLNCLDIFLTYVLLQLGAMEANPFANYFFQRWNIVGMVVFKLVIVTIVCVIAQLVGTRRLTTARMLLMSGSLIVGGVVVYSLSLLIQKAY